MRLSPLKRPDASKALIVVPSHPDGAAQTTAGEAPQSANHVFPKKRAERLRSEAVLETSQRRNEGDVRDAPLQTSTSKRAGVVERDS